MKFIAATAILSLAASTLAYPLYERAYELEDEYSVATRELEFEDYLDARFDGFDDYLEARFDEFMDYLEARTGPFHPGLTAKQKATAHGVIDHAKAHGQIGLAAAPGTAKTILEKDGYHLDRQQPPNKEGVHKVALQTAGTKEKGKATTVAQVSIGDHGHGQQAKDAHVAAKLHHSLNTGKEHHVAPGPSKKQQNIAKNQAAQQAKKDRIAQKEAAGKARAAAGVFRKGNKGPVSGTYPPPKPVRSSKSRK